MMAVKQSWDAELYEARHAFVWQFGESMIELLDPKAGERILDLGCGTGQLTHKMAERGASVVGLDSSPEMVGQARQNYPNLHFVLQDAAAMEFQDEFDAVFSNAALHWMLDAAGVAGGMYRALRTGGRLVAEFGGRGCVQTIDGAVMNTIARYSGCVPAPKRFFPGIGEYASLLEEQGFETRFAHLFDRPTPLEGEGGMENWIRQFSWFYFETLPAQEREQALKDVLEQLRPVLYRDGQWSADYRRIRIIAAKI